MVDVLSQDYSAAVFPKLDIANLAERDVHCTMPRQRRQETKREKPASHHPELKTLSPQNLNS